MGASSTKEHCAYCGEVTLHARHYRWNKLMTRQVACPKCQKENPDAGSDKPVIGNENRAVFTLLAACGIDCDEYFDGIKVLGAERRP